MNNLMRNRGLGDLLNIIAAVVGIVGLICYLVSAEDKSGMTDTVVSALVYVPVIVAVVLNAAALFSRINLLKIGAFAVYFLAFAMWCYTQGGYIVNVFMGIDGNVFSFAYILTIICFIAAMVLCIVSTVFGNKKKASAPAD